MATSPQRGIAPGVPRVHRIFALIFLAAALVQFVLAGYASFGGSDWEPHRIWGSALTAISLLVLILAAVGRREALQPSAVLFGLMVLQNILGGFGFDAPVLGALHPLVGLAVLGVAMLAAAGRPVRFRPPHGAA
jgi:peptidoglycan/LPS O-acetylase OafA/YrhL